MSLPVQRSLLICLFLLQVCPTLIMSQERERGIQLVIKKGLFSFSSVAFNEVVVLDNRFDTSRNEIGFTGDYPAQFTTLMRFDEPVSLAVKHYIEASVNGLPQERQTLFINLKQLRFGPRTFRPRLYLMADGYLKTNEGFKKFFSVNASYKWMSSFTPRRQVTKTVESAFVDLVKRTAGNYPGQGAADSAVYTFDDINKTIVAGWSDYPILRKPDRQNGFYRTFEDFRNNHIVPYDILPEMQPDSSFKMYAQEKDKSRNFWRGSKSPSSMTNQYSGVWAICYNGDLYIKITDRSFLPLNVSGNIFYFYVPYSLPNLRVIRFELAWETSKRRKAFFATVKNDEMRHCFLDMDSGNIVYH
jgi:hypothetical protein